MGPAAAERSQMWRVYLSALEEERRKIEVFGKELPLCLELVVQTIESYRRYLGDGEEEERRGMGLELELEEFIPINGTSNDDDRKEKTPVDFHDEVASDWLKSAQLWDNHQQQQHHHYLQQRQQSEHLKDTGKENNEVGNGGRGGGGDGGGGGKEGRKSQRKSRRCWLPELHRSFLRALEQLGGSEAATPKQIRELMNVEGLTNDEVKSHLQASPSSSSSFSSPSFMLFT